MERLGHRLRKLVAILDDVGVVIPAIALLIMAIMVATNTILRYVFVSPWFFVEEYSAYIVIMITFLALGYTLKEKGHLTIDIGVHYLSERARARLAVVTTAISLVIAGIMLKYSIALVITNWQHHICASSVMLTPLWIPQVFVSLGLFIFCLELMVFLATKVNGLRAGYSGK